MGDLKEVSLTHGSEIDDSAHSGALAVVGIALVPSPVLPLHPPYEQAPVVKKRTKKNTNM